MKNYSMLFLSLFLFSCEVENTEILPNSISDTTVTVNTISATNTGSVNMKGLNVKGNGLDDDRAAIQNAIKSNTTLFFPKGTYLISKPININGVKNLKITGEAGTIIQSSQDKIFIISGNISNLEISKISHQSTRVSSANDGEGLVFIANYGTNDIMDGININYCTFSNPKTQANAIKLVSEGMNSVVKNISIKNNRFVNIGRMGIEFQNHERKINIPRFRDYQISNNYFYNVGTIQSGTPSCCVSVSGYAVNGKINENQMIDMHMNTTSNIYYGIENAGTIGLETKKNYMISKTYGFTGIMGSHPTREENRANGQPWKRDWKITDNVIILTGENPDKNKIRGMEIANVDNFVVANNTVTTDGMGIVVLDSKDGIIENNTVDVKKSGTAVYLRLTSTNNIIRQNKLICDHSSYFGVVFFDGKGASGNSAYNNVLVKTGNQIGDYVNFQGASNNTK